jgi:hypothetical protein
VQDKKVGKLSTLFGFLIVKRKKKKKTKLEGIVQIEWLPLERDVRARI